MRTTASLGPTAPYIGAASIGGVAGLLQSAAEQQGTPMSRGRDISAVHPHRPLVGNTARYR